MAAPLMVFFSSALRQSVRSFSSTCSVCAGKKWRLENGLARTGSEYGPLTDLPDWSFADGRPAPLLKGQIRRRKEREEFAENKFMPKRKNEHPDDNGETHKSSMYDGMDEHQWPRHRGERCI